MTESPPASDQQQIPESASSGMLVVEGLAEDMVARWRLGERPVTEFYLDRFPQFRYNPEDALELIAEELALREEFAEPVSLQELDERFPLWPAQIRALIQCQRTLGRQTALFPSSGEVIGDFRLISELGRGSHSRVFLASQPELGNRLVVLKLSPITSQEHLSLARLQHSNIVPLYSMHDFQSHGLRGLCQPYFGGAALSDVLERIRQRGHTATGSDLFAALHPEGPGQGPTLISSPNWKSLKALNDVICWIGACLADALQYAHDRGLLHLDIKPSNVLLAADGVPMLLDFHLARPPVNAGEPAPAWLGGSPAYMPPEQLAALEAVRHSLPLGQCLDARADVYALGIVLKEAFAKSDPNRQNATSSIGLNDILERCTAAKPDDRYPTAAALAHDLRRHLASLPLSGVPNRSLAERYRKWRRRRPHGLTIGLLSSAVLVGSIGWLLHANHLAETADRAHQDGLTRMSQGRYLDAIDSFRGGETLANGLLFRGQLRSQLRESRLTAERAQAVVELHQLCEQIRPYYAAEFATPGQAQLVERRCRDLWEQRQSLAASLSGQATPDLERRWREDLMDVAILLARLRESSSSAAARHEVHRDALLTLEQAESLLGAKGILYLERARHARALAQYPAEEAAKKRAQDYPPESAWDHLVLGRYHLANQDVRRALAEMDRSLQRDPQSLWAHYFKGVCCLRLGRPVEAVAEFSACMVTAPNVAWCTHNLGQAYLETGELELAQTCFDRALTLDLNLAASLLGRATIHQNKGRYTDALADLNTAGQAGIAPAEVEYRKALVYIASGNRPAAISSLRSCLQRDPRHILAQEKLNRAIEGK